MEIILSGKLGKIANIFLAVTTGHDLQCSTTQLTKFTQQLAKSACRESITCRVCQHCQTTCAVNPLQRLIKRGPLARHIPRLVAHQIAFENLFHVFGIARCHKKPGKVCPTDDPALGIALCRCQRIRYAGIVQAAGDFLGTPVAKFVQLLQAGLQCCMLRIDMQAHHVQGLVRPAHRNLDAWDQFQSMLDSSRPRLGQARCHIVVGHSKGLHPAMHGMLDQFGRRQTAIGCGGMGMQVVVMVHGETSVTKTCLCVFAIEPRYHNVSPRQILMIHTTPVYRGFLNVALPTMRERAAQAIAQLEQAYDQGMHSKDKPTPHALGQSLLQFFAMLATVDHTAQESGISTDELQDLADHGLPLLEELHDWAQALECREASDIIQSLCVTLTLWCAQHQLTIGHLQPVVNALSRLANATQDTRILGEITDAISVIIAATAPRVKQDLDQSNPGRPWRLLNLNHGIVATRSHDPGRMESVFEQLMFRLPAEAPEFFADGMQQMEAIGYPVHVRNVMQKYYELTNKPTLH